MSRYADGADSRLLGNALFKGQRGWVGLNNPKYQKLLGISEVM